MAGGFTPEAFSESMNLAWILSDGQTVMVPDSSDVSSAVEGSLADPASQPDSGLIDLNRASLSELMTLPGIGNVKAQAIIAYREQHKFQTIEEVMNVSGIKENLFEKIRNLITVS